MTLRLINKQQKKTDDLITCSVCKLNCKVLNNVSYDDKCVYCHFRIKYFTRRENAYVGSSNVLSHWVSFKNDDFTYCDNDASCKYCCTHVKIDDRWKHVSTKQHTFNKLNKDKFLCVRCNITCNLKNIEDCYNNNQILCDYCKYYNDKDKHNTSTSKYNLPVYDEYKYYFRGHGYAWCLFCRKDIKMENRLSHSKCASHCNNYCKIHYTLSFVCGGEYYPNSQPSPIYSCDINVYMYFLNLIKTKKYIKNHYNTLCIFGYLVNYMKSVLTDYTFNDREELYQYLDYYIKGVNNYISLSFTVENILFRINQDFTKQKNMILEEIPNFNNNILNLEFSKNYTKYIHKPPFGFVVKKLLNEDIADGNTLA
jgi:hypothetical protein